MQKVIELSQSVVVDKSLIERFEEIQRQSFMTSSCSASENLANADAATSGTSMSATATSIMMEATTGSSSTTKRCTTTTTKSISMSTFETRRTLSSCNGSPGSSSNASSCSSASLNGNLPRPARETGTEKQSLEMLLLQHKQQLAEQAAASAEAEQGQEKKEEAEAAEEEVAAHCNIVKQQITLSLDLPDNIDSNNTSNNNNEEQQQQQRQRSPPQTPITATTPSAVTASAAASATTPTAATPTTATATAAAASHGSSSNIPQKPIKVQSDKDCTVPYNIINNYFSVGVVSALSFPLYHHIHP